MSTFSDDVRHSKLKVNILPKSASRVVPNSKHNIPITVPQKFVNSPWNDYYVKDPKKIKFFTGLKPEVKDVLWRFLGEAKQSLTMIGYYKKPTLSGKLYSISLEDQFSLFLAVLRRNLTYTETAWMFGVSRPIGES